MCFVHVFNNGGNRCGKPIGKDEFDGKRFSQRLFGRLADFLPWAALVSEGVVLNKDGSFQRTARFRGPDLDSSVPAELVGVAARLNNAFRRLGSGWAIFVEAQRNPATRYPESRFPDPVSALVDAERNLIGVRGSVPGATGAIVYIKPARKGGR